MARARELRKTAAKNSTDDGQQLKKIPRCSSATRNTRYSSKSRTGNVNIHARQDARNLKRQHTARNMLKKRLPAVADRAVRGKATKGGAGITWDSVVEKAWKDTGGDREGKGSTEKEVGRYEAKNRRKDTEQGKD